MTADVGARGRLNRVLDLIESIRSDFFINLHYDEYPESPVRLEELSQSARAWLAELNRLGHAFARDGALVVEPGEAIGPILGLAGATAGHS